MTLKLDQVQSLLRALDIPNVQRTAPKLLSGFVNTAVFHSFDHFIPATTLKKVKSGAQSESLLTIQLVLGGQKVIFNSYS